MQPKCACRCRRQDLSGLEDQLRNITDQIETLRKPGVEQAINALRGELGEIARTLNDASRGARSTPSKNRFRA